MRRRLQRSCSCTTPLVLRPPKRRHGSGGSAGSSVRATAAAAGPRLYACAPGDWVQKGCVSLHRPFQVRIIANNKMRTYVAYALGLLTEKGHDEVVLRAMGRAITRAVIIGGWGKVLRASWHAMAPCIVA